LVNKDKVRLTTLSSFSYFQATTGNFVFSLTLEFYFCLFPFLIYGCLPGVLFNSSRNPKRTIPVQMNRGGTFLKKLLCCVGGEYNKMIWFYQLVDNANRPSYRISLRWLIHIINPVDNTCTSMLFGAFTFPSLCDIICPSFNTDFPLLRYTASSLLPLL